MSVGWWWWVCAGEARWRKARAGGDGRRNLKMPENERRCMAGRTAVCIKAVAGKREDK